MAGMFPTYDYETEMADLARRQKIVDAMQMAALSPMEMPQSGGSVASKASWLSPIAKIAQAYLVGKQGDVLKGEQDKVQERYKTDLVNGINQYSTNMEGGSARIPGEGDSDAYGGQIDYKADPKKAMLDAIASNHPVIRQMGLDQFKAQFAKKASPELKDLMHLATQESVLANPTDPSKWQPKIELKGTVPGEVLVDGGGKIRQPGPQAGVPATQSGSGVQSAEGFEVVAQGPGWDLVRDPSGDLYQRSPTGMKKLDNAPKITNNIDTAGNSAGKAAGKDIVERLSKSSDTARQIPQMMTTLHSAADQLKAGMNSGATGEITLALQKVGKSLGLPGSDDPAISNTEAYRGLIAKSVLPIIEKLKPASDKDVEYAKQAAGGQITLDDQAMLRLINSAKAEAANQLLVHHRLVSRYSDSPLLKDLDVQQLYGVPFNFEMDPNTFDGGPSENGMGLFSLKAPPQSKANTQKAGEKAWQVVR